MTTGHEEHLLIDGALVPAAGGATYETVAPATEEVLGVRMTLPSTTPARSPRRGARSTPLPGRATTPSGSGACGS